MLFSMLYIIFGILLLIVIFYSLVRLKIQISKISKAKSTSLTPLEIQEKRSTSDLIDEVNNTNSPSADTSQGVEFEPSNDQLVNNREGVTISMRKATRTKKKEGYQNPYQYSNNTRGNSNNMRLSGGSNNITKEQANDIISRNYQISNLTATERERYVRYVMEMDWNPYIESIEKFETRLFARNKNSVIPENFVDSEYLNMKNQDNAVFTDNNFGASYTVDTDMDNNTVMLHQNENGTVYNNFYDISKPFVKAEFEKHISNGDQNMYRTLKYQGMQAKMNADSTVKQNARIVNQMKSEFAGMFDSIEAMGIGKYNDTSNDEALEKAFNERMLYDSQQ